MPDQYSDAKIIEPRAKFQLPDWVPKDFQDMVEELAKKNGMTAEEYLSWLWNTTTPEEAERYREIAETLAKILMIQEDLSDLLAIQRAEILKSKEELDTIEQLIHKAQTMMQQAEEYSEQGHYEKAEELFKQANSLLEFTSSYLAAEKEHSKKRDREIEELNTELDNLTQELLELTKGDDDLLNTAKVYALLEWLYEVRQ